jgi:hypothetical protein
MSGVAAGMKIAETMVVAMGKMMRTRFDTGFTSDMTTCRSFFVVSRRMMGGWMTGTRAM